MAGRWCRPAPPTTATTTTAGVTSGGTAPTRTRRTQARPTPATAAIASIPERSKPAATLASHRLTLMRGPRPTATRASSQPSAPSSDPGCSLRLPRHRSRRESLRPGQPGRSHPCYRSQVRPARASLVASWLASGWLASAPRSICDLAARPPRAPPGMRTAAAATDCPTCRRCRSTRISQVSQ
jgi:hypothetical protein